MSRLKDINQHNWTTLTYDGIPIPRYASFEYVLNEKINTTEIAPELWDGFLTHAKNAFITAAAGAKLLEQVKPDALLSYNSIYSCNHIMCCLAEPLRHSALHFARRRAPQIHEVPSNYLQWSDGPVSRE